LAAKSSVHFVSVRIWAENRWTFKRNSWREWRDKFSTYRVTYIGAEKARNQSAPAHLLTSRNAERVSLSHVTWRHRSAGSAQL